MGAQEFFIGVRCCFIQYEYAYINTDFFFTSTGINPTAFTRGLVYMSAYGRDPTPNIRKDQFLNLILFWHRVKSYRIAYMLIGFRH